MNRQLSLRSWRTRILALIIFAAAGARESKANDIIEIVEGTCEFVEYDGRDITDSCGKDLLRMRLSSSGRTVFVFFIKNQVLRLSGAGIVVSDTDHMVAGIDTITFGSQNITDRENARGKCVVNGNFLDKNHRLTCDAIKIKSGEAVRVIFNANRISKDVVSRPPSASPNINSKNSPRTP